MSTDTLQTATEHRARHDGPLGVVHIPKTGGTAVRKALSNYPSSYLGPTYMDRAMIGESDLGAVPPARRAEFATDKSLRSLCRTHRLVMGHYGAQALLDAGCGRLATQLREPRSRLLSLYRFWQAHLDRDDSSWGRWDEALRSSQQPFEEFLASPEALPATDNAMTRQLLVRQTPTTPEQARRLGEEALRNRRRYRRLKMSLSVVEWMADSQRFVERIFDSAPRAGPVEVLRVNEAVVVGDPQGIGPGCRSLLDDRTHLDTILLSRLMADGLVSHRSQSELDAEFEDTAGRLAFTLG